MLAGDGSGGTAPTRVHVPCPVCGSIVVVPADRLGDGPKCGRCRSAVLTARPTSVVRTRMWKAIERSDLPVLLDVGADWCQPCKAFAPEFEKAAEQLHTEVICLYLDVDADRESASRLQIQAVPTLILFRDGREVARTNGASSASVVLDWTAASLRTAERS